jgi:hypothetical protein
VTQPFVEKKGVKKQPGIDVCAATALASLA